jgi:hypothetical protein
MASSNEAPIDIKQDAVQKTDRCVSRDVPGQASGTRIPDRLALRPATTRGSPGEARLSSEDAQTRGVRTLSIALTDR